MRLTAGVRLGPYEIQGFIGAGGMGEVYRARDTRLGRTVALKILTGGTETDPERRRRFEQEARAASALNHPHICVLHDVGSQEGTDYLVMECLEGQSLAGRIERGPLPFAEALEYGSQIAAALDAAHRQGIIHRDLKPGNVMLTKTGVKLLDFGLAKLKTPRTPTGASSLPTRESPVTGTGSTLGTLGYMAPEQLEGKEVDARSDLFAFGAVLYEMLTGKRAFEGSSPASVIAAILDREPPPVSSLLPTTPPALDRLLQRCLAKDPDKRWDSAHDVADQLLWIAETGSGKGTQACAGERAPSGFVRAASRTAVRSRVRTWSVAALLVATVVLGWFALTRMTRPAMAFKERDWLLIADVDNRTADKVFDASLDTAFTISIQQSKYVNVYPRARVQNALKRMLRGDVTKLDEAVAREVALRESIKGVLACSLSNVGAEYMLAARVVDPNTQQTVWSQTVRTHGKDNVLAAVDDLAQQVRRELGESLGKIAGQRRSLPQATTSSLDALKVYADAMRPGNKETVTLLKRALELDPQFAMAHSALGLQYYFQGDRVNGEAHFAQAMGLLDRLTERETLWIRALVEDWRGNREQGIAGYRVYLTQYPDDANAWFRLGYAYQMSARHEECIEAYRRMLEIDRLSASAYINTASCYSGLRKYDEAAANYEKAFAIRPADLTGVYVNHEYGFLLVKIGQAQKAADVFAKMFTTADPDLKARGHRSLGLLDMYLGKYRAAGEQFSQAILLTKVSKATLSEVRNHLLLATALRTQGLDGASDKEFALTRALQASSKIDPAFLAITGRLLARFGKLREAIRVLEELKGRVGDVLAASTIGRSNQGDLANYHLLSGEVQLASAHRDAAIEAFQLAEQLGNIRAVESLAHAYALSGQTDKAIAKYQEFLEQRTLGSEWQEAWLLAHIEIGKLYERKGQPGEAATYCQRLLDNWKDADQDLPPLLDARRTLARVTDAAKATKVR